MKIQTLSKTKFILHNGENLPASTLGYTDSGLASAELITSDYFLIRQTGTGIWHTMLQSKKVASTTVEPGARLLIQLINRRKKYRFIRSSNWRLRFSLYHMNGEEMLALLPRVNWQKESHDFILQLNEEYEKECDSFLILQALHCANLCLSMMNGGKVPVLINI
ncbi:MAG: hypothetical protein IPG86_07010 [Chitinophagaceae bacterium]|nr:hypothetical protein [Chitinophagaceae bacterium]